MLDKIPGLKSGSKKKKLIIGFLYIIAIVAVIGMLVPDPPEEANPQPKSVAKIDKPVTEEPPKNKKDQRKSEKEASNSSESEYKNNSDEAVELTEQSYDWFLNKEENQLVRKIVPMDKGDYSTLIVTVDDGIKTLTKDEKKVLADSWGRSIVNLTNSNLGTGFESDLPYVEFRYSDSSVMATPEMLGNGWKTK